MTEDRPAPDPTVERLAATAEDMVQQAGEIAHAASQKMGPDGGYSAADLIASTTKLTNVALAGGLDLAKAGMDGLARPGSRTVADRMAVIGRRMISESGKVAESAVGRLDAKSYTPTEWVKSMIRLSDIALFGGIELVETALAGPGQYEKGPVRETFVVVAVDDQHARRLSITSLSRPGAADPAVDRASLDPAVLPAGEQEFTLCIDAAGLASGMYIGEIHVGAIDPDASAGVVEVDMVVNVVL